MKNKKGFTLVEVLAVIVILAIVISIAVTSVTSIRANSLKKLLETKISNIEGSAIMYAQDNQDILDEMCVVDDNSYDFCKVVTVKVLVDNDYYKAQTGDDKSKTVVNDVTNKSMLCDTVQVYKKNNRIYAKMLDIYSNDENYLCK